MKLAQYVGICVLIMLILAACGKGDDTAPVSSPESTLTPLSASATPMPAATPTITEFASVTATPEPKTPTPSETADYVPLAGHDLGPGDAAITIIMYGDFQCELCARYARDLEELRARYPNDVRLIWRHLPDPRAHDKTILALQASEAAAAQGQFWPMHDQLFTHQPEWIELSPDAFRTVLSEYARVVGLDVSRFETELDSEFYLPVIDAAQRDAADLGIVGAPLLLFNGIPYTGRDDLFGLDEAVRLALLEQRWFDAPPPMTIDPMRTYRATILTEQGEIMINLFAGAAPVTVNNFVFLAHQGWYDDTTFHYVIPGFVAQTGDPSNTGRGGPGYTIPGEHNNGLTFDRAGLVAMAHPPGVPGGAGSQFFITLAPLLPPEEWNGRYTIFGEVISGMEIVTALTPRNANDPVNFPDPAPGDRVISVTIEEAP